MINPKAPVNLKEMGKTDYKIAHDERSREEVANGMRTILDFKVGGFCEE